MDAENKERLREAERIADGLCAIGAIVAESGFDDLLPLLAVAEPSLEEIRSLLHAALGTGEKANGENGGVHDEESDHGSPVGGTRGME